MDLGIKHLIELLCLVVLTLSVILLLSGVAVEHDRALCLPFNSVVHAGVSVGMLVLLGYCILDIVGVDINTMDIRLARY